MSAGHGTVANVALALYRKYRPRSFAEVIGQDHVTEPLMQALRSGRLNHAYLFSGPRGCGKTSSARILARSLNCVKGPTPDPCGECDSCRALAPDGAGSIDVIEIDAASHGGVDDARDLRERAFFAPVSSRYKIYVIDEAHMVSSAGFNALLKLVEEPPDYVKFVFATTEPEKVLGTIKSRTHHYPFRLIPPGVLRPYLESLCAAEGVTVQPAVFPLVVRAGAGSARDTLSVLDQLIAGAGPEGVTYARAVALLGVTDAALIDEMCDALAAGDGAAAYATIDRVAEAGHDPRRFAGDLLERLRDLIVLQQVPDAAAKGLLGGAEDELDRMTAQADRFGPATLSRLADIMHTGLTDMRGTTAPRLVLELLTARMLLPGVDESAGALLQRMERMERRLTLSGGEAPPATSAATPTDSTVPTSAAPAVDAEPAPTRRKAERPAPVDSSSTAAPSPQTPKPAGVPQGGVDAAAIRRIWDEVLTIVRRKSPKVAALVREATVRDVTGDTIVLVFKHHFHAQALASTPELLVDALYEVLGGRWQLRCEVAGQSGSVEPAGAGGSGPPRAAAPATQAAVPSAATSAPPSSTTAPSAGSRGGRASSGGSRQRKSDTSASEDAPPPANVPPQASAPTPARQRDSKPAADDEDWPALAPLGGVVVAAADTVTGSSATVTAEAPAPAPTEPARAPAPATRAASSTGTTSRAGTTSSTGTGPTGGVATDPRAAARAAAAGRGGRNGSPAKSRGRAGTRNGSSAGGSTAARTLHWQYGSRRPHALDRHRPAGWRGDRSASCGPRGRRGSWRPQRVAREISRSRRHPKRFERWRLHGRGRVGGHD